MRNLFSTVFLFLSIYSFAQGTDFSKITAGELILKNNQKITFSELEDQGDKIYFYNLSTEKKEHLYKSSIISIDGKLLTTEDVEQKAVQVKKQKVFKQLEFVNSRNILMEGKKLSKDEVYTILHSNNSAFNQYKSGRTQKTIGSVLIGVGAGLFVGNGIHNLSLANSNSEKSNPPILFFIGGGIAATGIVLNITGTSSVKKSISTYNNRYLANNHYNKDLKFLVSNNGAGLRLNF